MLLTGIRSLYMQNHLQEIPHNSCKIFPEAVEDVKTAAKKVSSNVDEAIAVAIAAIMARKANK